jgi:hypothetical protein
MLPEIADLFLPIIEKDIVDLEEEINEKRKQQVNED